MTVDEAYRIIENLNEEAHSLSWDTWIAADVMEESDFEDSDMTAEEMREDASAEQASYFRENFVDLKEEERLAVEHYIKTDKEFQEQFKDWYGWDEFEEEYGDTL